MTVIDAINEVYSAVSGLSIRGGKYKYSVPGNCKEPDYIVVNSLPINEGVLQRCIVNVNIHVKDLEKGKPDTTRLEAYAKNALGVIRDHESSGQLFISLNVENHNIMREEALGEHYSNIRVLVILLNE